MTRSAHVAAPHPKRTLTPVPRPSTTERRTPIHGPAQLLALQRTAGNAAVSTALKQRQPGPVTPLQRDVIITNPILVKAGDTDAQGAKRQQISDTAIAALPIWASSYANLWLTAATTALASTAEPEDKSARQNWWVALAGNLTWAATSLLAPELALPIRLMSFGGAAVGSGALATDAAPSGKGAVALQLGRARDGMVKASDAAVKKVAVDCGFGMVEDIEQQKQMLWKALLPAVPYESSETLVANMQGRIAKGLKQFADQYAEWETGDEGATPEKLGAALGKRSLLEQLFSPPDTFVVMEQLRQQWKLDHPFAPKLDY